jgi:hypothetical protein
MANEDYHIAVDEEFDTVRASAWAAGELVSYWVDHHLMATPIAYAGLDLACGGW